MKNKLISILLLSLLSLSINKGFAQIKKANHFIVLIDNSASMRNPNVGQGFTISQLRRMISNDLPVTLFGSNRIRNLVQEGDYISVYFYGVNNQTNPDNTDLFESIGFEYSQVSGNEFITRMRNLDLNHYFNKDFAGTTLARQLAIYNLGQRQNKPENIEHTYLFVLTDGQLNSNDITTELENSPFVPSRRGTIRRIYEKVTEDYSIPVSESRRVLPGRVWPYVEIKPRVYDCDFNVRSLLMDLNSNIELKRIKDREYKGKYHATINPAKTNRYKIVNVNWRLFDRRNNRALSEGHLKDFKNGINIDLYLSEPVGIKNNYQLQLTYDILLLDVLGTTVVSSSNASFDATDNLSMAVGVQPEKDAKIFGIWDLPSSMYFTILGDQYSNTIVWNVLFSLLVILIILFILRYIYIYEFSKKTNDVNTTIE
jgi:hypothetical protein